MSTVETRLLKLEASARRWRLAAVALGLGLVLVIGMGQKKDDAKGAELIDHLRVRRLEIVNSKGQPKILLLGEMKNDKSAIAIMDPKGIPRIMIEAGQAGAGIKHYDTDGTLRLSEFHDTESGESGLVVLDGKRNSRVLLRASKEGIAGLLILDSKGTTRFVSGTDADGNAVSSFDGAVLLPDRLK